jgi:hypothetical protein
VLTLSLRTRLDTLLVTRYFSICFCFEAPWLLGFGYSSCLWVSYFSNGDASNILRQGLRLLKEVSYLLLLCTLAGSTNQPNSQRVWLGSGVSRYFRNFVLRQWGWNIFQSIASAVSGLMASGLLQLGGVANLQGWKWLFLVDGIITVFVAVATWYCYWIWLYTSLTFSYSKVLSSA